MFFWPAFGFRLTAQYRVRDWRPSLSIFLRICEIARISAWINQTVRAAHYQRWVIVRREKALDFSGCNSRPGTGSLHPVAIEATAEATKLSEPSV